MFRLSLLLCFAFFAYSPAHASEVLPTGCYSGTWSGSFGAISRSGSFRACFSSKMGKISGSLTFEGGQCVGTYSFIDIPYDKEEGALIIGERGCGPERVTLWLDKNGKLRGRYSGRHDGMLDAARH